MKPKSMVKGALSLAPVLLLGAARPPAPPTQHYGQVIVREQIIVRIGPSNGMSRPQAVVWKEGKGPKCVPARLVAGYEIAIPASVDFMLRDNRRVRARLDRSCPPLDYYRGFYVMPNPDGMICADRDVIRSRMGGECVIDKFRSLKPKKAN